MRWRIWLATNPVAVSSTMALLLASRPAMKANIMGTPRPRPAAPPMAPMNRTCVPVSAPMPWIMPTPNAVRAPYEAISMGSTWACPCRRAMSERHPWRTQAKTSIQRLRRRNSCPCRTYW